MSILHLSQAIISPGQHLDCYIMKDPEPDSAKFSSLPSSDRPLFFNPGDFFICFNEQVLTPMHSTSVYRCYKKTLSLLNFRLLKNNDWKHVGYVCSLFPISPWGNYDITKKKKNLLDLKHRERRKEPGEEMISHIDPIWLWSNFLLIWAHITKFYWVISSHIFSFLFTPWSVCWLRIISHLKYSWKPSSPASLV